MDFLDFLIIQKADLNTGDGIGCDAGHLDHHHHSRHVDTKEEEMERACGDSVEDPPGKGAKEMAALAHFSFSEVCCHKTMCILAVFANVIFPLHVCMSTVTPGIFFPLYCLAMVIPRCLSPLLFDNIANVLLISRGQPHIARVLVAHLIGIARPIFSSLSQRV